MDLIVVPSLADSCPNTMLESIYNNILVIGAKTGGIPEIINNDKFLFEPNAESLENKLFKVITDMKYRKKLYEYQEKRKKELSFNWEEKILNILE